MADDRAQARREAAILLGVDIEHLSAADGLRVDMVSSLRLVIDAEQAAILTGNSADLAKLNIAVQSLIALLPGKELPEPMSSRPDPRQIMLETYKRMRERGAQFGLGYDGLKLENERLRAEIAALKAAGAPAPDEPSAAPAAPPAPGGNVVPLKPAQAAPEEEYEDVVVTEVVTGEPEPWRSFIGSDGSIMSTPGRKFWGPVGG
jgi:hypothetical protein